VPLTGRQLGALSPSVHPTATNLGPMAVSTPPRARRTAFQRLVIAANVLGGIAMITSAPEALALHERTVQDMWHRALKGPAAAAFMRGLMANLPG